MALKLDLRRRLVCGRPTLVADTPEGYLRGSPTLFAVKHALRMINAGVVPAAPLNLNRHVRLTAGHGFTLTPRTTPRRSPPLLTDQACS
jgi:hypothetical protein